jgi:hypothetical protein
VETTDVYARMTMTVGTAGKISKVVGYLLMRFTGIH